MENLIVFICTVKMVFLYVCFGIIIMRLLCRKNVDKYRDKTVKAENIKTYIYAMLRMRGLDHALWILLLFEYAACLMLMVACMKNEGLVSSIVTGESAVKNLILSFMWAGSIYAYYVDETNVTKELLLEEEKMDAMCDLIDVNIVEDMMDEKSLTVRLKTKTDLAVAYMKNGKAGE